MIVNEKDEQVEMESRDWNLIMPAYVRQYMYLAKNTDPKKVVFVMFKSVQHPTKPEIQVPVVYVEEGSPEAKAIMHDGSNVPEASEADILAADERWDNVEVIRTRLTELESEIAESARILTPAPEDLIRQEQEANPPDEGAPGFETDLPTEAEIAKVEDDVAGEDISLARAAFAELNLESVPEDEVTEGLTPEEETYEAMRADIGPGDTEPEPPFKVGEDQPSAERMAKAKSPDNPIPYQKGVGSDLGGSRDTRDQVSTARDLVEPKGGQDGFPPIEGEDEPE